MKAVPKGHSELWDGHPDAMSDAVREHDELITSAVNEVDGRVVKGAGDGAMTVFADAAGVVAIQQPDICGVT